MNQRIVMWIFCLLALLTGPLARAQSANSAFMQRIADLKRGQVPAPGLIQALEKHEDVKFARALCRHGGVRSGICEDNPNPTIGWAMCIIAGREPQECGQPKVPSLGFGLCMAADKDLTECNYVQSTSVGYGLCMASGRSFHECSAPTIPSQAFGYCMASGEDVSNCLRLGPQSNKTIWVQN